MNRTINPQEFKSMLDKTNVTIIDVRRKEDYAADSNVIPGANWMDPTEISSWSESLPADKEIVLYCVMGGAVSNSVVDTLQAKGLKARFIEGGISAWKAADGKVVAK